MKSMSFYHNIQLNLTIVCYIFFCMIISSVKSENRNIEKTGKSFTVSLQLTDYLGFPINNVKITIDNKVIKTATVEEGEYHFIVKPEDIVTLTAPGYNKIVTTGQNILQNNSINFEKSEAFAILEDEIPLPIINVKKSLTTGSYTTIKGEKLEAYPSTDIRRSFIGKAPGLQVTEQNGAPGSHPAEQRGFYGLGQAVDVSARGLGMDYVIDGVPVNITEIPLDPGEIETITVIKDIVGKTLYGPMGAGGIIYIQTKRGKENEAYLNINVESGVNTIDRFPKMVSAADYARLNNYAREADGMLPLYSSDDIAQYEKNDPYNLKYPSVNYQDYMLKNTRPFQRINISAGGGGERAQYTSYLGYNREGDIFGIGSTSDYNRINIRSNLDIEVNDYLSVALDINGSLGIRRTPSYGYTTGEGQALMGVYEFNLALPQIRTTPPNEFPIYANNDPELSAPWYGISPRYVNPVGNILGSGDYTEQNRQAGAKLAIRYDLSRILNGLTSNTSFAFDALNLMRIGQANRYEGYRVNVREEDTVFTRLQAGISDDTRRKLHDYYYIRTTFSQVFNYKTNIDIHDIESSLAYFAYRKFSDGLRDPEPQLSGVWTGRYTYDDKYTIQGVLNYAHTYSFLKNKRSEVFPALGIGWIISKEDLMSNIKFVNFLKLRGEIGVIGYDPYLDPFTTATRFTATTRTSFGPHPLNRWFGSNVELNPPSTYPQWVGNPDLGWEKRKEFNIGLDGLFFDQKLSFEISYYNTLRDGIIGRQTNSLPGITGTTDALPYVNHNKYRYYGIETGLKITNNFGKLIYSVGGNATFQNSKIEKYDEPNYRFDYQFRNGQSVDTYWGLTYIGKFKSDEEAFVIPQLFDPVLKKGDLKYKDMNNDGVVDENDNSAIGNTSPRLFYSLNLNFKYSNFELMILGVGAALFDIPMTNAHFFNGWGDNNYSTFVRDNLGDAYPRLTYNIVNNNFRSSTFWLTKGDYFKIKNIEVAYTMPCNMLHTINSKEIRFFVRGANLLTISSVKDIDPESPSSGVTSYPLNKTVTAGVSLTF